jgi:hypothetical protein
MLSEGKVEGWETIGSDTEEENGGEEEGEVEDERVEESDHLTIQERIKEAGRRNFLRSRRKGR